MDDQNPYQPPSSESGERVFKTPLVVPLATIVVLAIFFGYIYFQPQLQATGFFGLFQEVAFFTCFVSQVVSIWLLHEGKRQVGGFLENCSSIKTEAQFTSFKQVARANMYQSLILLFLMLVGTLALVVTIFQVGGIPAISVVVLAVVNQLMVHRYRPLEDAIKQIPCSEAYEQQVRTVIDSWFHRALPDF